MWIKIGNQSLKSICLINRVQSSCLNRNKEEKRNKKEINTILKTILQWLPLAHFERTVRPNWIWSEFVFYCFIFINFQTFNLTKTESFFFVQQNWATTMNNNALKTSSQSKQSNMLKTRLQQQNNALISATIQDKK